MLYSSVTKIWPLHWVHHHILVIPLVWHRCNRKESNKAFDNNEIAHIAYTSKFNKSNNVSRVSMSKTHDGGQFQRCGFFVNVVSYLS